MDERLGLRSARIRFTQETPVNYSMAIDPNVPYLCWREVRAVVSKEASIDTLSVQAQVHLFASIWDETDLCKENTLQEEPC